MVEKISTINTDYLVIDTLLSRLNGAAFEVRYESVEEPRHAIDFELVLVPTREAVLNSVLQFGYHAVVLRPNFTDYTGAADYKNRDRRAFICSKRSYLTSLNVESQFPEKAISTQKNHNKINLTEIPARSLASALAKKVVHRVGLKSIIL